MAEGGDKVAARVMFEHAEKRRKLKLKQVQEFMASLRKKSRQGVCLNLLPKESVLELKKSRMFNPVHESYQEMATRFGNSQIQRSRSVRAGAMLGGSYQQPHSSRLLHSSGKPKRSINLDMVGVNQHTHDLVQSMKESGNKQVATMFAMLLGKPKGADTDDKEGAEKLTKIKVPFYELNQEERMIYHRIKSAKKDKKHSEELKNKREDLEWKSQQS